MIFNLKMISFQLFLMFDDVYHTTTSWMIIDFLITMYFCRLIISKMFHVKVSIILITLYLFINFVLIWRRWNFHLNLKFNWIFSILRLMFAFIRCFFNVILIFILYFFEVFKKRINSCFRLLNLNLCLSTHLKTLFYAFFNTSQFYFINSLYVNMLMSFTKFVTLKHNLIFSYIFNKFAL